MSKKDIEGKGLEGDSVKTNTKNPRRRLLASLAFGGVAGASLPSQWTRPVVNAVVLPAHAQTSEVVLRGGGGGGSAPGGPGPSNSFSEDLLDFFINPAQAAGAVNQFCVEITVEGADGEVTDVVVERVCYNSCKPGIFYDQTTGEVSLSRNNGSWTGIVGTNNHPIVVSDINLDAGPGQRLADVELDGVSGVARRNDGCDCSCNKDE